MIEHLGTHIFHPTDFETSALNTPKMALNTTRSKVHVYHVYGASFLSRIFQSASPFELRAALCKVRQIISK